MYIRYRVVAVVSFLAAIGVLIWANDYKIAFWSFLILSAIYSATAEILAALAKGGKK